MRLALLICDDVVPPVKAVHGDYGRIFTTLLASALARTTSTLDFTLDTYDVVEEKVYPPDNVQYDGLLITGSRASAHQDVEWINTLVAYTQRILSERPALKIFGICFGHQIVARALGGSCVPNNGLWEVAVTTIQLTPLGKAIFGTDTLDIQQMHQDHVPTVPSGAHLLASNDVSFNQGMVVFDPASTLSPEHIASGAPVDLTSIQVLTVQGHPEFTEPIMSKLLELRVGILGDKVASDGQLRAGGIPGKYHPDGLACDGVGIIGKVIWAVLGIV